MRRRVVEEDLRVGHDLDGLRKERPVVALQAAASQALGIDAGLLGDQSLRHLFVGHLQREDGDMLLVEQGGILGDGQQESGLALPGPAGDDQQVRRLQASKDLVEVDEAGRYAVDLLAAPGQIHRCDHSTRSGRCESA